MMKGRKQQKLEYGDFQTPKWISDKVCELLWELGIRPAVVVEPTCGKGSFLFSALDRFPSAEQLIGMDINPRYVELAQQYISEHTDSEKISVSQADFFEIDWNLITTKMPSPLLFIGNPPWVTNSELASLNSRNLPTKSNFQRLSGIDAITGSSNFDISEWMLLKLFELTINREVIIAMLCKTSVARKVLRFIWEGNSRCGNSKIFQINAKQIFNANVDACLFVYDGRIDSDSKTCDIYDELSISASHGVMGYRGDQVASNLDLFEKWNHLETNTGIMKYKWRSGIKHDCAKVMELKQLNEIFVNKFGEENMLEEIYLYPLVKSSDLEHFESKRLDRWMIVTQHAVGDSTLPIKLIAPSTWKYLQMHSSNFSNRKSSIYRGKPRFSIFGVGKYSFAPWKVAISGLYKNLNFTAVGPREGKPTVFDDTCYFIPCEEETEARFLTGMLNSQPAQEFYQSLVFWDAKRPITAKILRKLDISKLALELNQLEEFESITQYNNEEYTVIRQLRLLEEKAKYISAVPNSDTV